MAKKSPVTRLLGGRVLVEPVEREKMKGGLYIPETAQGKSMEAVVVAIGSRRTDESGKDIGFDVIPGDRVLVSKYGGTEIKIDDKDYTVLSADDILAIL